MRSLYKLPGWIVSWVAVIMTFHYYLSYKWISGFLRIIGVNDFGLYLSFEDLAFPCADINISVFTHSFIGLAFIVVVASLGSNKSRVELINISSRGWGAIKSFFLKRFTKSKGRDDVCSFLKLLLIVFLLIVLSSLFFCNLPAESNWFNFWYTINVLIFPIIFFFVEEKNKSMIVLVGILSMFFWADKLTDRVLEGLGNDDSKSQEMTQMSFDYLGENVVTSDSLYCAIRLYEYTILKSTKNDSTYIYSNTEMKNLRVLEAKIMEE